MSSEKNKSAPNNDNITLSISDLSVEFNTPEGEVKAVSNVNYELKKGKSYAVVGESGSGKSQSFLAMMGLLAKNGQATGNVMFNNNNLLKLSSGKLDRVRGNDISMIFQDPMTSLNPSLSVEKQLSEVLIKHQNLGKKQARDKVTDMLSKVGIPEPVKRLKSFPHQLSGGMRQRVMIAMALLCEPKILIADEPTTALDVTIQAQILDIFQQLCSELNTTLILITHDLGVVAGLCDEIMVMYAGKVIEQGSVNDIFYHPQHPYTLGLLQSTPNLLKEDGSLSAIDGLPPNLQRLPKGCAFASRCPFKHDRCLKEIPLLENKAAANESSVEQKAACFFHGLTTDMAHKFNISSNEIN